MVCHKRGGGSGGGLMPVDISRKVFGCANVRKTWSERILVRIIKGDNDDWVTESGLGREHILRTGVGRLWV